MRNPRVAIPRVLVHVLALLPLAILVWEFTQGRLTANPIQYLQLRTGDCALALLVITLAATPVNILFGIKDVVRLRRTLGLYAFMYAGLHFLNFTALDYRLDFNLMLSDVSGKRYVLAGLAAFLVLLLLAVTSVKPWMKRLGKNWGRIHWFIYVAAVLAVTHYLWQVKADIRLPLLYGVLVVLLLAVRTPYVRRAFRKLRPGPS